MNEWLWNIDNNLINGVIFLDFKKAFDTMNHVMEKLWLYGASSHSLNWFGSYLTERKQQTFIGGTFCDFCDVTCGIAQESILGPPLLTVYIDDLPACNLFSKPRMYADDTTLTLSAEDPLVLDQRKNHGRNQFQWLCAKKLTLNVKKTKFMVFGSHYKLSYIDNNFSVKVENTPIDG